MRHQCAGCSSSNGRKRRRSNNNNNNNRWYILNNEVSIVKLDTCQSNGRENEEYIERRENRRTEMVEIVAITNGGTSVAVGGSDTNDVNNIDNSATSINTNTSIDTDINVNSDINMDTDINANTDDNASTDINANADANGDINANTGANGVINANTGANGDINANTGANDVINANKDANGDINANTDANGDINANTNTNGDINANIDANGDINANADENGDINANTDSNGDINANINTNTDNNININTDIKIDGDDIDTNTINTNTDIDTDINTNTISTKIETDDINTADAAFNTHPTTTTTTTTVNTVSNLSGGKYVFNYSRFIGKVSSCSNSNNSSSDNDIGTHFLFSNISNNSSISNCIANANDVVVKQEVKEEEDSAEDDDTNYKADSCTGIRRRIDIDKMMYNTRDHEDNVVCKSCGEIMPRRDYSAHSENFHGGGAASSLYKCVTCNIFFKTRRGCYGHMQNKRCYLKVFQQQQQQQQQQQHKQHEQQNRRHQKQQQTIDDRHYHRPTSTSFSKFNNIRVERYDSVREKEEKYVADIINRVKKECEKRNNNSAANKANRKITFNRKYSPSVFAL